MLKKLIIVMALFVLPVQGLYAAEEVDYYLVTNTETQADLLDIIITSINVFIDDDAAVNTTSKRYYNMLSFIVMLGTLSALITLLIMFLKGNTSNGFVSYTIYLMTIVFIMILAFGPKATVMVQTKYNSGYAVKELPEIIAFTLGMFFAIKKEIGDLSEIAFNLPDPTDNVFMSGGGEGLGFVGGEVALANMWKHATFSRFEEGDYLSSMWARYIRDCFLLPASSTQEGEQRIASIMRSNNLASDLSPDRAGFSTELIDFSGEIKACSEFWEGDLKPKLLAFENNTTDHEKYISLGSALGYFGAMADDETAMNNAASLKAAITQAVLSNEFSTTFSAMGIAGEVYADGAAQATADIQTGGFASGLFMAEKLPMVAFLIFLIMVAALPFVIAFSLLPGSLSVLSNYLKTLLWVTLWEPMGNILSLLFDYRFAQIADNAGTWTNHTGVMMVQPSTLIHISSEAASFAGIAGWLFIAVQGLSWMLITGSGQMLGNMMSGFGTAFNNRANADAQIAARTEMLGQKLTSSEMGEMISLREQYAYSAMSNAGALAGSTAGTMDAFGRDGLSMAGGMAHTGAVKSAWGHGSDIGMTNELGSGKTAARVSQTISTRQTSQQQSYADHLGSNASQVGSVIGAGNAGMEIGETNTFGGDPNAAFATKETHAALKTGKELGGASVFKNTDHAASTGIGLGLHDSAQTLATSKAVENMSWEDIKNGSTLEALNRLKMPVDALNKTASSLGLTPEASINTMINDGSTRMAEKSVGDHYNIKGQGGHKNTLHNSAVNEHYRGNVTQEKANTLDAARREGISSEEIAKTEVAQVTGATVYLTKKGKELQNIADKAHNEAKRTSIDAQNLQESNQQYRQDIQDYKDHIQELSTVSSDINTLKEARSDLEASGASQEDLNTIDAAIADKRETATELASQNVEKAKRANIAGKELQARGDSAVKNANKSADEAQKIAAEAQQDADTVKNIDETIAIKKILESAFTQGQGINSEKISATRAQGDGDIRARIGNHQSATKGGMTVGEVREQTATADMTDKVNQIKIAEKITPALQQRLKDLAGNNVERREFLEKLGVFNDDPVIALAAIRSLKNMQVNTTGDGMEISLTSDETGEVTTQYIHSKDGVNLQATLNADYASLTAAKAINEQDIETQKFLAITKSIGQNVFDVSPAGRSWNLFKQGKGAHLLKRFGRTNHKGGGKHPID